MRKAEKFLRRWQSLAEAQEIRTERWKPFCLTLFTSLDGCAILLSAAGTPEDATQIYILDGPSTCG